MTAGRHPFGMNPTEKVLDMAVVGAREVYEGCPETTCCQRAICCHAGCPNMYYSEFLSIRRGAVDRMTSEQRVNLTVECVRRYLQDQRKAKPCVFLGKDNLCQIYEHRHLKCRLYGLIPPNLYEWITAEVAKELNTPKSEIPLCSQCDKVEVKPEYKDKFPNNKVPESSIKKMEKRMRELDRTLGMSQEVQDEGFGFLTYHDWHLLFELGEEWMETLTKLRTKFTDEQKEQFVQSLKIQLEKSEKKKSGEDGDGQK